MWQVVFPFHSSIPEIPSELWANTQPSRRGLLETDSAGLSDEIQHLPRYLVCPGYLRPLMYWDCVECRNDTARIAEIWLEARDGPASLIIPVIRATHAAIFTPISHLKIPSRATTFKTSSPFSQSLCQLLCFNGSLHVLEIMAVGWKWRQKVARHFPPPEWMA